MGYKFELTTEKAELAGVVGNLRPAEDGVDAGDELLHLKGLDDVVVRPHLQPLDAVEDLDATF